MGDDRDVSMEFSRGKGEMKSDKQEQRVNEQALDREIMEKSGVKCG